MGVPGTSLDLLPAGQPDASDEGRRHGGPRFSPPRNLSRQQRRALEREKRTATGWIAALGTDDPWLRQAIRAAIGTRAVTRAELAAASLA